MPNNQHFTQDVKLKEKSDVDVAIADVEVAVAPLFSSASI